MGARVARSGEECLLETITPLTPSAACVIFAETGKLVQRDETSPAVSACAVLLSAGEPAVPIPHGSGWMAAAGDGFVPAAGESSPGTALLAGGAACAVALRTPRCGGREGLGARPPGLTAPLAAARGTGGSCLPPSYVKLDSSMAFSCSSFWKLFLLNLGISACQRAPGGRWELCEVCLSGRPSASGELCCGDAVFKEKLDCKGNLRFST